MAATEDRDTLGRARLSFAKTADIDESNNNWGTMPAPSKFAAFKQKQQPRGQSTGITPMQKAQEKKKGFY